MARGEGGQAIHSSDFAPPGHRGELHWVAFNRDLRRFLGGLALAQGGSVSSHSFRSGVATSMAAVGYSDQEIMAMGRWHSEAFLRYIRRPREKRAMVAQELASRMARLAVCN